MTSKALMLVLLAGINSCVGNILLKYSRLHAPIDAGAIGKFLSIYFIGGVFFYVINVILFAKALDESQVAIAYPILAASGFAFLTVASYFIFSEKLNYIQGAGLCLVIIGIFMMAKTG